MTTNPRTETAVPELPPKLAIDARGFVWRVYDTHWSMAPSNPDNQPIPGPMAYYVLVSERLSYAEAYEAAYPGPLWLELLRAAWNLLTKGVTDGKRS